MLVGLFTIKLQVNYNATANNDRKIRFIMPNCLYMTTKSKLCYKKYTLKSLVCFLLFFMTVNEVK